MKSIKLRCMVAAVSGALFMGFGANAMADSTFDLVDALVKKGVLTEEEALPLLSGRENDIKTADKKVKKAARVTVSDAIDNATVYGDVRVRYEDRQGSGISGVAGNNVDASRDRARYKITLGVKTESNDFYSDIALSMGAGGRSDNATFGSTSGASGNNVGAYNAKETVFVKRAMLGWKATDWLTLEAGRMENPLYTTPMVWDADLTFQGVTEKLKYTTNGNTDLFFTASQFEYLGDKRKFSENASPDLISNRLLAFQGGAKLPISPNASAKAAITYATYTNDQRNNFFTPGINTSTFATVSGANSTPVNDLKTIEIPAEFNFMATSNIGLRVFGDYVYNIDGDDRKDAACATTPAGLAGAAAAAARAGVCGAGTDDTAWMVGLGIGSAPDLKTFESNKMVKGDWAARIWYQDVGAYSVDPNAVDSDFMDSRVNMKGIVFKSQYNLRDNVFVNFAAGHAKRKNNDLGTAGTGTNGDDIALNLKSYDLYQLDVTYKF